MSKELSSLVIYRIFKGKYLAKYEFSIGETLAYDAKCISLYSLPDYILFYCYYPAVACKNYHGISMVYKYPWRILVGPKIFSQTAGPIWTNLGRSVPWEVLFKKCSQI